jgi:hypothetical protein
MGCSAKWNFARWMLGTVVDDCPHAQPQLWSDTVGDWAARKHASLGAAGRLGSLACLGPLSLPFVLLDGLFLLTPPMLAAASRQSCQGLN